MKNLGTRLKEAREYLGLTQEDVAKLMGVSRVIITNIEAGTRKVSAEELSKFSKIYGWTMEELMEGEKAETETVQMFARTFNELSDEDKRKLQELCRICPRMQIIDELEFGISTPEDYIIAERWIESVLEGTNPDWSTIQKVAYIDNAIGKKLSYSPDFDTEVSEEDEARALWKIINSGYGMCNGIAQIEAYMLRRLGIESEKVSGRGHAFLKLKGIELQNSKGEIIKGDTIIDPTWNLAAHRYGAMPQNFCKSYEEIRKNDIDNDGVDKECHKNDEALATATLNLDEQSLRNVFASIGIADKDGNFPIKTLMDKSKAIDDKNLPAGESMRKQLHLLAEYCPDFSKCQNETMQILQGIVLNQRNLKFNKCVVSRVYAKEDIRKRPILYVYADLPEEGKKFYFASSESMEFMELSQNEFELAFECYVKDIEKHDGHRPWEEEAKRESTGDLKYSSGAVDPLKAGGR